MVISGLVVADAARELEKQLGVKSRGARRATISSNMGPCAVRSPANGYVISTL
jgi:hypothetical protein